MAEKKSHSPHSQKSKETIAIEDADLWKSIIGTVKPIDTKNKNKIRHSDLPEIKEKKRSSSQPISKSVIRQNTPKNPKKKHQAQGPQLTGIDRRSKQKLLRGNIDIDRRIDLHGLTQIEARARLKNFLSSSQKANAEYVLVITGKGASPYTRHILHGSENYSAPEREGVLRQSLPEWMKDKEFSELVSGFQPAHPKHGGGGAFYIKLRRRRKEM